MAVCRVRVQWLEGVLSEWLPCCCPCRADFPVPLTLNGVARLQLVVFRWWGVSEEGSDLKGTGSKVIAVLQEACSGARDCGIPSCGPMQKSAAKSQIALDVTARLRKIARTHSAILPVMRNRRASGPVVQLVRTLRS